MGLFWDLCSEESTKVAKGHLPIRNGGLFHSEDRSSRFEPQHSCLQL